MLIAGCLFSWGYLGVTVAEPGQCKSKSAEEQQRLPLFGEGTDPF